MYFSRNQFRKELLGFYVDLEHIIYIIVVISHKELVRQFMFSIKTQQCVFLSSPLCQVDIKRIEKALRSVLGSFSSFLARFTFWNLCDLLQIILVAGNCFWFGLVGP